MDYHLTTAELDIARELHEMNLSWPYGVGDHFCTNSEGMQICIAIEREGEKTLIRSHEGTHSLEEVSWLPKRTQAMQWLLERGWKITVQSNERMARVEGLNRQSGGTGVIEGFGKTELEALYAAMLQVLEQQD